MSDFEDKLNAILADPDAMGQIMGLAQALGKKGPDQAHSLSDGEEAGSSHTTSRPVRPQSDGSPAAGSGGLDPRLLDMAVRLLSAYQSDDDDRAALLAALRPFVRPERYAKLDQAIRISKLTRVIRVALDSFRGMRGEAEHV